MRPIRVAVAALLALALASGCGSNGEPEAGSSTPTPTDGWTENGPWLLRFNTAEGADGEVSRSVYISYDPGTGVAKARRMPAVLAGDSFADEQALLIDADQTWSLLDTKVGREGARGRITLYSTTGKDTWTLPLRGWAGEKALRPIAAAFDPAEPGVLRAVDSERRIWKVDLAARSATHDGDLPRRTGWIYGNGFDKNTGLPYIEDIDSEKTEPAGNGDSDTRPVERRGGHLLYYDGADLPGLPKLPCGFAGGFTDADGASWIFCADTPSISAYRVAEGGTEWKPVGTPSADVVPGVAAELAVVLPPL